MLVESICIAMAIAVGVLLVFDAAPRSARIAKACASACFVALGFVGSDISADFDRFILLGLLLAAVGDVALSFQGVRAFRMGIVAFALGHVAYIAAVASYVQLDTALPYIALSLLPSGIAYRWLYPHLGAMRAAVAVYVVVITLMVGAAFTLFDQREGALLFTLGALAFYASDLSVARDRFVQESFVNRAWGLPAYYLGQACIALSAARL